MTTTLKRFGAVALAGVLLQGVGLAQLVDGPYSASIPTTLTAWGPSSLDLPKFNPALGTLLGVELEFTGDVTGSISVRNNATSFISGTAEVSATISVVAPEVSSGNIATLIPLASQSLLVFAGQTQTATLAASVTNSFSYTLGVDDLTAFIGLGDLEVDASASGLVRFRSSGNTTVNGTSSAAATATITYLYEPPTSFETSVNGFVWCDADLDGLIGAEEVALSGWQVELVDVEFNEVIGTTTTGEDGEYLFTGVTGDREYRINVVSQNGFPPVSDPDGLVVFDGVDFVDSSNTAIIYVDLDNNGPFNFGYACEVEECAPCDGRVSEITLQLNGASGVVKVKGKHGQSYATLFEGFVADGGVFTAYGFDKQGSVGTEIYVYLDGGSKTSIHTSCSVPIGPGMEFGKYTVVEAYSVNGGLICPTDEEEEEPPTGPDCGPCEGRVKQMTLQINGASGKVTVTGKHGRDTKTLFYGYVADGGTFTIYGFDKQGSVGTEIYVSVNGCYKTAIHTSCSVPIGPGMVFGKYTVVEAYSVKGGLICETDGGGNPPPPPPPPPAPDCGPCDGRVSELTLQLNGTSGKVKVIGKHGKDTKTLFYGHVSNGGTFTIEGFDKQGSVGTEIYVSLNGGTPTAIHTSCSVPIGPGMVFGKYTVVEAYSVNGGLICESGSGGSGGGGKPKGDKYDNCKPKSLSYSKKCAKPSGKKVTIRCKRW